MLLFQVFLMAGATYTGVLFYSWRELVGSKKKTTTSQNTLVSPKLSPGLLGGQPRVMPPCTHYGGARRVTNRYHLIAHYCALDSSLPFTTCLHELAHCEAMRRGGAKHGVREVLS